MAEKRAREHRQIADQRAALAEMNAPREPVSEENRKRLDALLKRTSGTLKPMKEPSHGR